MKLQISEERFNVLTTLQAFVHDGETDAFILRGSAGTGKTTLIAQLVKSLIEMHVGCAVLAPTGRAARILGNKLAGLIGEDKASCSTIHAAIYTLDDVIVNEEAHTSNDPGVRLVFPLKQEEPVVPLFIVDESSMVGDRKDKQDLVRFGSGRLLSDLVTFARTRREGKGTDQLTKLLFVGDPIQLPPVGEDASPALSEKYLQETFGLRVRVRELQTVFRQARGSALLARATELRDAVVAGRFNEFALQPNGDDIQEQSVTGALQHILDAYRSKRQSAAVVHSNAAALEYNRSVRERLWGSADEAVRAGDILLVMRNAWLYHLANGDLVKVLEVDDRERVVVPIRGGFRPELLFRKVKVARRRSDGSVVYEEPFILENLLDTPDREITPIEQRALLVHFRMRHPQLKPGSDEFRQTLRGDPYFNAVQVKYGYALTCHKAQGGEWDTVVVDFSSIGGMRNAHFFRWAYTAITRARRTLIAVNPPHFTAGSELAWAAPALSAVVRQPALEELQKDPDWDRLSFTSMHASLMPMHQQLRSVWRSQGIEIQQLQHLQYLERYVIASGDRSAVVQYHYDGKFRPRAPGIGPGAAQDRELAEAALVAMRALGNCDATAMDTSDPFIGEFLQRLDAALASSEIRRVGHEELPYRLRVRFRDERRQGAIDFSYNGKSMWTTALEVGGPGRTNGLYQDVQRLMAAPRGTDT